MIDWSLTGPQNIDCHPLKQICISKEERAIRILTSLFAGFWQALHTTPLSSRHLQRVSVSPQSLSH